MQCFLNKDIGHSSTNSYFPNDSGIDSGGNFRNITRNQIPTQNILGSPSSLSWFAICEVLIATPFHTKLKPKICIVDTLLCSNGVPIAYFYTDAVTQRLTLRPPHLLDMKQTFQDFKQISHSSIPRGYQAPPFVACMTDDTGSFQLLDELSLTQILNSPSPSTLTISAYKHPKGTPLQKDPVKKKDNSPYCNIRNEYKLDKRACPQERHILLNVNPVITGTKSRKNVISRDAPTNKQISDSVRILVNILETQMHCRVVRMKSEFVQEGNDSIWLVRVYDCQIASEPRDKIKLKRKGNTGSSHIEEAQLKRFQINQTLSLNIERNSQPIRQICEQTYDDHTGFRKRSKSNLAYSFQSRNLPIKCREGENERVQKIKSLSLIEDVMKSEITGSSQLATKCQGDFCSYNLQNLISSSIDLNNVEQSIYGQNSNSKQNSSSEFQTFCSHLINTELEEDRIREANQEEESYGNYERTHPATSPIYELPRSFIIEARRDKHLIDVFLRNHINGSKEKEECLDLSSTEQEDEFHLATTLPGHYYMPVKVCENCYCVYNYVKKARGRQRPRTAMFQDGEKCRKKSMSIHEVKNQLNKTKALTKNLNRNNASKTKKGPEKAFEIKTEKNDFEYTVRKYSYKGAPNLEEKSLKRERVHQNAKRSFSYQMRKMNELTCKGGQKVSSRPSSRTLLSGDNVTMMQYEIVGTTTAQPKGMNFIVCHDIYDTIDMTKILFTDVTKEYPGCQALLYNQPGQSGTTFPYEKTNDSNEVKDYPLNNEFQAEKLYELIMHVADTGEFPIKDQLFCFVGIGHGLSILLALIEKYQKSTPYFNNLKAVVSINGFATLDTQITAILHSSSNIFRCIPDSRPDLPVAYFTQYLFSSNYIEKISRELALNIYTAISNPIALKGRIRLTNGALKDRCMKLTMKQLKVPIFVIQSTENNFVHPSNVDILLDGRNASYIWSHQIISDPMLSENCFMKNLEEISKTFHGSNSAMAIFIRSGHAIAQEYKKVVVDLLKSLHIQSEDSVRLNLEDLSIHSESSEELISINDSLCEEKDTDLVHAVNHSIFSNSGKSEDEVPVYGINGKVSLDSDFIEGDSNAGREQNHISHKSDEKECIMNDITQHCSKGHHCPKATDMNDQIFTSGSTRSNSEAIESNLNNDKLEGDIGHDNYDIKTTKSILNAQESELKHELRKKKMKEDLRFFRKDRQLKKGNKSMDSMNSSDFLHEAEHFVKNMSNIKTSRDNLSSTKENLLIFEEVDKIIHGNHQQLHGVHTKIEKESNIGHSSVSTPIDQYFTGKKLRLEGQTTNASAKESTDLSMTTDFIEMHGKLEKNRMLVSHEDIYDVFNISQNWVNNKNQLHHNDSKVNLVLSRITNVPPTVEELQRNATLELDNEIQREKLRISLQRENKLMLCEDIEKGQRLRRQQYSIEDNRQLRAFGKERCSIQDVSEGEIKQRAETDKNEYLLVEKGIIKSYTPKDINVPLPVMALPKTVYGVPSDLPNTFKRPRLDCIFDDLRADQQKAKKMGVMAVEEFERIKVQTEQQRLEKEKKLQALQESEKLEWYTANAIFIQKAFRGYRARVTVFLERENQQRLKINLKMAVLIQSYVRSFYARTRVCAMQQQQIQQLVYGKSVNKIQAAWRGRLGRILFLNERRLQATLFIQCVLRGYFARKCAEKERQRLDHNRILHYSALKIQCGWKAKLAVDRTKLLRFHGIAAIEIQRVFRGYIGYTKASKLQKWAETEPGPERIKLGLQLIKDSKKEFERQREEIDTLHLAQENVEIKVNRIHKELKESEKELNIIEHELQEIDEVEHDVEDLIRSQETIQKDGYFEKERKYEENGDSRGEDMGNCGGECKTTDRNEMSRVLKVKKAERERKKQHLESEFTFVLNEVQEKRNAIGDLEVAIADIEATRERKDREFNRLQRNLMELLHDQKYELEKLREKGVELETATATSAAAAAETATKARDHEKQTNAMFNQQEELMKFQFMSMSLSYFSSLKMLKQMRGFTTDTTASVLANTADTAAAAAAATAAANISSVKHFSIKTNGHLETTLACKESKIKYRNKQKKVDEGSESNMLPEDCRLWTIKDVSTWLCSLSLNAYVEKFEDGCVDGDFLLELREEDLASILGIEHKLHRKKILLAREKIKPLSAEEKRKRNSILCEEEAEKIRQMAKKPDSETVFSQARHGRLQKLEESFENGFDINAVDEMGNTILMIAVQNDHRKMVEFLIRRGVGINHTNGNGNSALHFALAYDKSGQLAEYLIENGADDTIENSFGLSPYDGLGEE